jgi:hypothetical protein
MAQDLVLILTSRSLIWLQEDLMSRMLCFFLMIDGDVALFMEKSGYQIKRMCISIQQKILEVDQLVFSVVKQSGEYVPFLLLTLQVKELRIYFANHPHIAKTMEIYFQNVWTLSTLNLTTYTKVVWDKQWQVYRNVQCWSHIWD